MSEFYKNQPAPIDNELPVVRKIRALSIAIDTIYGIPDVDEEGQKTSEWVDEEHNQTIIMRRQEDEYGIGYFVHIYKGTDIDSNDDGPESCYFFAEDDCTVWLADYEDEILSTSYEESCVADEVVCQVLSRAPIDVDTIVETAKQEYTFTRVIGMYALSDPVIESRLATAFGSSSKKELARIRRVVRDIQKLGYGPTEIDTYEAIEAFRTSDHFSEQYGDPSK